MNFVWASPSGIIDNPAVHRSRELSSRHNHVIFFNRVPSSRLIRATLERDAMTRRSPFQRERRSVNIAILNILLSRYRYHSNQQGNTSIQS
jgi:hypothetical protein